MYLAIAPQGLLHAYKLAELPKQSNLLTGASY